MIFDHESVRNRKHTIFNSCVKEREIELKKFIYALISVLPYYALSYTLFSPTCTFSLAVVGEVGLLSGSLNFIVVLRVRFYHRS